MQGAGTHTNISPPSPCSHRWPRPLWLQADRQWVGRQEKDLSRIDLPPAAAGNPRRTRSRVRQNGGPRCGALGIRRVPRFPTSIRDGRTAKTPGIELMAGSALAACIQHRGPDSSPTKPPPEPASGKSRTRRALRAPRETLAMGPYAAWRLQPRRVSYPQRWLSPGEPPALPPAACQLS